ncbi:MAG: VPLPA-CTERM sorting domain-containing protein [Silicimonas sp.]|nr:VPLPA-CTERM sorting domain-containing protein [Silicimonas sp.]
MYFKPIVTASALALSAAAAQADTFTIDDYTGFGQRFEAGTLSIDILGAGPDYSAPDGAGDINLTASGSSGSLSVDFELISDGPTMIQQRGGFAHDASGNLIMYQDGDVVERTDDVSFLPGSAQLYDGSTGPLANVGDSGIFGFVVDFVSVGRYFEEEFAVRGSVIDAPCEELDTDFGCGLEETVYSYYGWIQVERGSIIPGILGLNDAAFRGAAVTLPTDDPTPTDPSPVPLPAAGWMLLAGVAGLGALRRKG